MLDVLRDQLILCFLDKRMANGLKFFAVSFRRCSWRYRTVIGG